MLTPTWLLARNFSKFIDIHRLSYHVEERVSIGFGSLAIPYVD